MKQQTRPERFLSCGMGLALVSVIGCGVWSRTLDRRVEAVAADLKIIRQAVIAYRSQYDGFPTRMKVEYDFRYGLAGDLSNNEVFNALRAKDGPGNENHAINPKKQVFIDVVAADKGRSGLNPRNEFVDPWGQPYQIVLDLNNNNLCDLDLTIHGSAKGRRVAVWSYGPDRKGNTPDDILGWQVQEEFNIKDRLSVEDL